MSSESEDSKNFVGIILRTNGKVETYTYTGYESIRDAVGGMIECVTTGVMDGERWDLWGNEEGRLLELPMNQVAREFIAKATSSPLSSILSLHGDFLLLGVDDEGDSIAAPNEIAALAVECAMFDEPVTRFIQYDNDGNIVSDETLNMGLRQQVVEVIGKVIEWRNSRGVRTIKYPKWPTWKRNSDTIVVPVEWADKKMAKAYDLARARPGAVFQNTKSGRLANSANYLQRKCEEEYEVEFCAFPLIDFIEMNKEIAKLAESIVSGEVKMHMPEYETCVNAYYHAFLEQADWQEKGTLEKHMDGELIEFGKTKYPRDAIRPCVKKQTLRNRGF